MRVQMMPTYLNSPTSCSRATRARSQARALCVFVIAVLLGAASTLHAATATASWDPNPEPDIAGYKLSFGTQSGVYTTVIDVGNVTSWSVTLTAGQRYFSVVQAYDTSSLLSVYSAEVIDDVPSGSPPTIVSSTPASGPSGTVVDDHRHQFRGDAGHEQRDLQRDDARRRRVGRRRASSYRCRAGATSGTVVVTVGGLASNGVSFTVTVSASITSLSPTSGPVGTAVTITGTNFGATQGTSTIRFNGTTRDADELVGDEHRRAGAQRARRAAPSW